MVESATENPNAIEDPASSQFLQQRKSSSFGVAAGRAEGINPSYARGATTLASAAHVVADARVMTGLWQRSRSVFCGFDFSRTFRGSSG